MVVKSRLLACFHFARHTSSPPTRIGWRHDRRARQDTRGNAGTLFHRRMGSEAGSLHESFGTECFQRFQASSRDLKRRALESGVKVDRCVNQQSFRTPPPTACDKGHVSSIIKNSSTCRLTSWEHQSVESRQQRQHTASADAHAAHAARPHTP